MDNPKYIKFIYNLVKTIEKEKLSAEQTAGLIKIIEQVGKSKSSLLKLLPKNEAEQQALVDTYGLLESTGFLKTKKVNH